ncbi:MAG: hypothetical protein HUK22_06590, partial [Thermoguttaceae bacterium]|nr:hypothetical protein [Thermoguttaceae bacterium]
NPNVEADRGRVALQRGPVVYCFEQVDNETPIDRIILAKDPEFKVEMRENYISDENVNEATKGSASRTVAVITCKDYRGNTLTAVPYCVWDNRAAGKMAVWVRQAGFAAAETADDAWIDAAGETILYKQLDAATLTEDAPEVDEFVFSASFAKDQYSSFDGVDQKFMAPANSADQATPRATFWDRKGTYEWFEFDYAKTHEFSKCRVYWFDDRAIKGNCRVPAYWKLNYQVNGSNRWEEVETTDDFGVALDAFNEISFKAVKVDRIRLEVQLQEGFSGGILKWILE